jgi:hypothetical protein
MQHTSFKYMDRYLGAPRGWDQKRDGVCEPLAVAVRESVPGNREYWSHWRPNGCDLIRMLNGEGIFLCCVGGQPPVSLHIGARDVPIYPEDVPEKIIP